MGDLSEAQWAEIDDAFDRKIEAKDAEIARLRGAIRWALGEVPDADGKWFGEDNPSRRKYPFWWRRNLRRISGVDGQYAGE